jgi:hypothetical protein
LSKHSWATPLARSENPGEAHHPGTVCAGGAITLEHIRVDHAHLQLRAHNYQQLGLVFLFYAKDWIWFFLFYAKKMSSTRTLFKCKEKVIFV